MGWLYFACALTMEIETLYFFARGYRRREFVLLCLAANMATNLSLNLLLMRVGGRMLTIILLELLVVLAEFALYSLALRPSWRLLADTALANILSVTVGGCILDGIKLAYQLLRRAIC